jgi:hypothetical protein
VLVGHFCKLHDLWNKTGPLADLGFAVAYFDCESGHDQPASTCIDGEQGDANNQKILTTCPWARQTHGVVCPAGGFGWAHQFIRYGRN